MPSCLRHWVWGNKGVEETSIPLELGENGQLDKGDCQVTPRNLLRTETMATFENVTQTLVRQLNPGGDLIPLDSLIDFKRFRPFCLLRKRKSTLSWGAHYVYTDYTLLDVLEPGSSPSDLTDGGNFGFKNNLDTKVEVDVDVPKTMKVKGTKGLSHSSTLKVQTINVTRSILNTLQNERKLSADHPFLKEMQELGENLYVVMEAVKTKEEVTLEQAAKGAGLLSLPFYATLGLKASVNHEKNLTIPKGCVLAYRVRQLIVIGEDEWEIPHNYKDSMKTFSSPKITPRCAVRRTKKLTGVLFGFSEKPGEKKLIGEMKKDIKTLKEEVQQETQALEKLSPVGQSSLLTSLSHLLGKKKELQDLEKMLAGVLDKGREVTLEALPKDVLLSKDDMDSHLYFLGALTELREALQRLLVITLEKNILLVQIKLVVNLLVPPNNLTCGPGQMAPKVGLEARVTPRTD
ncbi:gasdermin-A-like isoform X1 [Mastomys coucha]|uniref:gasdermin-A-like isoform X1 n=2 Tax=Mastomys coucha TaxID=35658 RepID=UPI0012622DC1|nr:gasdermin-A-like isoform X1 [Mastomys coucha]